MSVYGSIGDGQEVIISKDMSNVAVGALGVNARLIITGDMNNVTVSHVGAGAKIRITGDMNNVSYGSMAANASIEDEGDMNNVTDLRAPSKRPRGQFPNNLFTSASSSSVRVSGTKGRNVSVVNGEVWIDGKKITPDEVKATDTPPEEPKGTFTVQKSHRPRQQWGT